MLCRQKNRDLAMVQSMTKIGDSQKSVIIYVSGMFSEMGAGTEKGLFGFDMVTKL